MFHITWTTFEFNRNQLGRVWLQLHGAINHPDSFVLMLRYCAYLKAIRYESTSLNRIVADKSHRVIVAYVMSSVLWSNQRAIKSLGTLSKLTRRPRGGGQRAYFCSEGLKAK